MRCEEELVGLGLLGNVSGVELVNGVQVDSALLCDFWRHTLLSLPGRAADWWRGSTGGSGLGGLRCRCR